MAPGPEARGRLYITTPNPLRIRVIVNALTGREIKENSEHKSAWHLGLLQQVIEGCGYKVIKAEYFTWSVYQDPLIRATHKVLARIFPAIFHENLLIVARKER